MVDELVCPAFIHCRLEATEHWHAVGIQSAQLAVEVGRPHLQVSKRLDRAPVAVRPVQSCPGQQLDVGAVDACVHAVAVVFDLVQAGGTRRRFATKRVSCGFNGMR